MALQSVLNDTLLNLDTIAQLSNHQTLCVIGNRVFIDLRYCQAMRRMISGDHRGQVIRTIEITIETVTELLKAYTQNVQFQHYIHHRSPQQPSDFAETLLENIKKLMDRIQPAISGLTTWKTYQRYINDYDFQHNVSDCIEKLNRIQQKYQEYTQHLKSSHCTIVPCCCTSNQETTLP